MPQEAGTPTGFGSHPIAAMEDGTMPIALDRRRFLATLSAAGASGLVEMAGIAGPAAAEPPPETRSIRLAKIPGVCLAPQYIADALLRAEGFTDIRFVETEAGIPNAKRMGQGEIDFSLNFAAPLIVAIDAGYAIKVLAGIHVGCFELFGNDRIRAITDLWGKSVAIRSLGASPHVFLSAIAAHVGLDPVHDINWVTNTSEGPMELFVRGETDAFLGFAPKPQELRARGIGHVIVNSAIDRPWSQYYCCLLSANADFARRNPVASKRVLRAILKATGICADSPALVARQLVDEGFSDQYDYTLQALTEIPYAVWRDYDPEDTIRFYSLRLREAGMIGAIPQQIIADGTDWRFLADLKRELKA